MTGKNFLRLVVLLGGCAFLHNALADVELRIGYNNNNDNSNNNDGYSESSSDDNNYGLSNSGASSSGYVAPTSGYTNSAAAAPAAGVGQAQPISLNSQLPPTLGQLYGSGAQVLYQLNFPQEPTRWDPRDNSSEFHWFTPGTTPHDRAFISLSTSGPYAKKKNNNAYGAAAGTAALVTAPYTLYIPPAASANDSSYVEAALQWNNNVTVAPDQRVVAEFLTSCTIYDAEKHPYPANHVSHPDDDPRLADCYFAFYITSSVTGNDTPAGVYFSITNKSIWAVYNSNNFIAKRRVGIRRSYNDIVAIAIEYNAATQQFVLYVAGRVVWIVSNLGQLPPRDGMTKIDVGQAANANQVQDRGATLSFDFGTEKCLDESDPWNQADLTRLVRVIDSDTFYDRNNTVFYDNVGTRPNTLWGQAAKMKLHSVVIKRTSANATATGGEPPSNIYGGSSSSSNNNAAYGSSASSDWGEDNNNNGHNQYND